MVIRYSEEADPIRTDSGFYEEGELPPSFEQLLILCIDTSISMKNPQKDDESHTRTHELFQHLFLDDGLFSRLRSSEVRRSFWTMGVGFDETAEILWPANRLFNEKGTPMNFPLRLDDWPEITNWGPRTSIGSGLFKADAAAKNWLKDDPESRFVTIAVISDGGNNDDEIPCLEMANQIKESTKTAKLGSLGASRPRTVIASAAYGQDAMRDTDWQLLRTIASDPVEFFREVKNGEQLRDFLIASATIKA